MVRLKACDAYACSSHVHFIQSESPEKRPRISNLDIDKILNAKSSHSWLSDQVSFTLTGLDSSICIVHRIFTS